MHAMTWQSVYIKDVWCVFLPATRVAVSATLILWVYYRPFPARLCISRNLSSQDPFNHSAKTTRSTSALRPKSESTHILGSLALALL